MGRDIFPDEGEVRWVSTGWLERHLEADALIIDAQPNVHDYIRGHIPGAVYLGEESLRLSAGGVPHSWLDTDLAEKVLARVSIDQDREVVVYTGTNPSSPLGDGVPQGMIAYSLVRYGHRNIRILDGGFDLWRQEEREISTRYRSARKGVFKPKVRQDLFVEYSEFHDMVMRDEAVHIDFRPKAQYEGTSPWPKPGHIPGAVNLPWSGLYEEGNLCRLRSAKEIEDVVRATGARPEADIICSCGSGRKAAAQLVVLRWLLGFPEARLFEGSMTEWCAHPDNETVIGPSPR